MDDSQKSPDEIADDARQVGQEAVDKARNVGADAKRTARHAADTGRAYAKEAVDAAGDRIGGAKLQLSRATDTLTQAIHDEPVKAVLIAAVVSSLVTALAILSARSERYERYY